jgi:hypothetical protein
VRRFPIARYLLLSHLPFLVMALAGIYLLVGVILGVVVAVSGPASVSAVDVAGQVLHWVAVGYGYGASGLLATVLVHGRTRREFIVQHPAYQLVAAVVLAALITGVYAAEAALYDAAGWTQAMQPDRPFGAGDYPMIFAANASMLSVALLTGSFAGVGVYRREGIGVLALLPAAGLLVYGGAVHGFFSLPFAPDATPIAMTLAVLAAGWALLWMVARDVPLTTEVSA